MAEKNQRRLQTVPAINFASTYMYLNNIKTFRDSRNFYQFWGLICTYTQYTAHHTGSRYNTVVKHYKAADPERFDADPDPTFQADADPDPAPDADPNPNPFTRVSIFSSSNLQLLFPKSFKTCHV